jgi:hypothetical protein
MVSAAFALQNFTQYIGVAYNLLARQGKQYKNKTMYSTGDSSATHSDSPKPVSPLSPDYPLVEALCYKPEGCGFECR